MKTGYFQFDAGINFRDDNMGINELRDGKNLYWRGNLKKRLGYEQRNKVCTSPSTGQYASSGMYLLDHLKFDDGTNVCSLLFMQLTDTGAATHAMTVFVSSGAIPTGTGTTYTPIGAATFTKSSDGGVGQIIPHGFTDPISIVPFDDKVWIALGDNNPYVLFYNGTGWWIHEVPLCQIGNTSGDACTGSTDGFNIIPGLLGTEITTENVDNADWDGTKMVGAANDYLHISDGRAVYYAPSRGGVRPDYGTTYTGFYDRTSSIRASHTTLSGNTAWETGFHYGLDEQLHIEKMGVYKKYLFLYGEDGIVSIYVRGIYNDDYDKIVETHAGVYGDIVICEKGVFYVGKDGIYGFDGQTATDLAKKIWPQVEDDINTSEGASIPSTLVYSSLAYHDGFIWVSFPDSLQSEVYVFDPDHIYGDEYGDSHAPMYRFKYRKNLIDRGDCESGTGVSPENGFAPMIFNETNPVLTDTTFARDNAEERTGTYSYKVTKTIASGTAAYATLCDNENTNDMHGMVAGHIYTKSAWVYVPTASGIALNEIRILIEDYDSNWLTSYSGNPTAFDTWQKLTVTRTIRSGATGTSILFEIISTAKNNEYFYVDDLMLVCHDGSNMSLKKIKEFETHLYGIDSEFLYEFDVNGLDEGKTVSIGNETTRMGVGIDWDMKSAYTDQEAPNLNKIYRKVIPETNEGIADGTTDGIYDFQLACSVNHSTGLRFRGLSTAIDLEYTTDAGHVSKTLDVPETSHGYILDGNNMSVELMGEVVAVTHTSGDVDIFGFTLDYETRQIPMEEVSS